MNKADRKKEPRKKIGPDDVICPGCGGPMFEGAAPDRNGVPSKRCPFCKSVWEIEEKR